MASNVHKSLARSIWNWRSHAEYLGLSRKSPADLDVIPSASEMDERTYMALRVLRPKRLKATGFPESTEEVADRTREHLERDYQFQIYLKHIENGEKDVYGQDELARFQIVRDNQLQRAKACQTVRLSDGSHRQILQAFFLFFLSFFYVHPKTKTKITSCHPTLALLRSY